MASGWRFPSDDVGALGVLVRFDAWLRDGSARNVGDVKALGEVGLVLLPHTVVAREETTDADVVLAREVALRTVGGGVATHLLRVVLDGVEILPVQLDVARRGRRFRFVNAGEGVPVAFTVADHRADLLEARLATRVAHVALSGSALFVALLDRARVEAWERGAAGRSLAPRCGAGSLRHRERDRLRRAVSQRLGSGVRSSDEAADTNETGRSINVVDDLALGRERERETTRENERERERTRGRGRVSESGDSTMWVKW